MRKKAQESVWHLRALVYLNRSMLRFVVLLTSLSVALPTWTSLSCACHENPHGASIETTSCCPPGNCPAPAATQSRTRCPDLRGCDDCACCSPSPTATPAIAVGPLHERDLLWKSCVDAHRSLAGSGVLPIDLRFGARTDVVERPPPLAPVRVLFCVWLI